MSTLTDHRGRRQQPIPQGQTWAADLSTSARWDYHLHAHNCYELLLIAQGHCKYTIGSFSAGAAGPTIFLLAPKLAHSFFTEGFLPDGQQMIAQMYWFEPRLVEAWRGQLPEFDAIAALLSRAAHGSQFNKTICAEIIERYGRDIPDPGIHGCTRIIDILGLLATSRGWQLSPERSDEEIPSHDLERIARIDDWIHAHYREPITLTQTADALDLSISTLNHLMKKFLRRTFLQHLNQIRIDEAKHQLQYSDDSITDIAFASGFNAIPTFNRRFKQMVGVSPQEHRKQFRFR